MIVFYLTAWPSRMMFGPLIEPHWLESLWDRAVALGRATCGVSDATPGRTGDDDKGATLAPLVDNAPVDPAAQRLLSGASSCSTVSPFDVADAARKEVATSESA